MTKRCPQCGSRIRIDNALESWRCNHCGKGVELIKCPKCNVWVAHEYELTPPVVIECAACKTFIGV